MRLSQVRNWFIKSNLTWVDLVVGPILTVSLFYESTTRYRGKYLGERCSDGNKTKMLRPRPRPRPVKQQQECITEKNSSAATACVLSKNNVVQKNVKKWWPVTFDFGTVSVLIARRNTGACYISPLSCHTASCRAQQRSNKDQNYKTKTKIEAGLRPVLL